MTQYCKGKEKTKASNCWTKALNLPAQVKGRSRGWQCRGSRVDMPSAVMAGSGAEPAWPWAPRSAARGRGLGRFCFPLSSQPHTALWRHFPACTGIVLSHCMPCSCPATGSREGYRQPPPQGLSFTPPLCGDRDSNHQPLVKCDKVAVLTHSRKYR